ncbi:hypothetical protein M5689_024713 [Euphorbia peplus]|nr:hypothetical protein M5689_024713 [Euphorbia peplus]
MTIEKNSVEESVPNLVQTRISVAPNGKVCAEMPSDAAEKTSQEIEEELMAVKLNVVIQKVEMNKKADVDMNKRADVDMNKRADVDMNKRVEDAEEDAPLTRKRTYRTKSSAAMRKPMRRSDFEIHPDPTLEDETDEP